MGLKTKSRLKVTEKHQRSALASPLRLEILGLFVSTEPLAISDMALLMNRSASSLYHHVGILTRAGFLEQTGSRPKGKRPEALYLPTASSFEYDTSSGEEDAIVSATKLMAGNFRMAERDLEAALRSDEKLMGGPDRDFYAFRMHFRASPERLKKINEHMDAILKLLAKDKKNPTKLSPDDQHVALTLALLPIKGRDQKDD